MCATKKARAGIAGIAWLKAPDLPVWRFSPCALSMSQRPCQFGASKNWHIERCWNHSVSGRKKGVSENRRMGMPNFQQIRCARIVTERRKSLQGAAGEGRTGPHGDWSHERSGPDRREAAGGRIELALPALDPPRTVERYSTVIPVSLTSFGQRRRSAARNARNSSGVLAMISESANSRRELMAALRRILLSSLCNR